MSGHGFSSAFASRLDAYLTFKAAMGFGGSTRIWYLKSFDAWCAERGRDVLDRDTVEGWVTWLLSSSGQTRSWMSYIRDFGRWSRAHGDADAYVLSDRWKAPFRPAHPYLLSQLQIESFFTAAARLRTRSPWRWQAVAFFTLMHSCGLRTGEVLALHTADVDLTGRHVDVLWFKGTRSRRLPVTGDVTAVLTACDGASQARFGPSRKTHVRGLATGLGLVLLVAQVLGHLLIQHRFQHRLRGLLQQPVWACQGQALLGRQTHQLLRCDLLRRGVLFL